MDIILCFRRIILKMAENMTDEEITLDNLLDIFGITDKENVITTNALEKEIYVYIKIISKYISIDFIGMIESLGFNHSRKLLLNCFYMKEFKKYNEELYTLKFNRLKAIGINPFKLIPQRKDLILKQYTELVEKYIMKIHKQAILVYETDILKLDLKDYYTYIKNNYKYYLGYNKYPLKELLK